MSHIFETTDMCPICKGSGMPGLTIAERASGKTGVTCWACSGTGMRTLPVRPLDFTPVQPWPSTPGWPYSPPQPYFLHINENTCHDGHQTSCDHRTESLGATP